jgi:hypothetical protein
MDTLFWKTLNKSIRFRDTKKQFFNQYLWRLELVCEFADLMDPKYLDLVGEIEKRKVLARNRNFGGTWRNFIPMNKFESVDYALILSLRDIRHMHGAMVKFRIETPMVQIYADNEQQLKNITAMLSDTGSVQIITGPATGTENILQSGGIIGSSKIVHKYKVMLRDGKYDLHSKQQLLNFLQAQGDDVKINAGLVRGLTRPYPGMWGAFFYTNDLGVTTMLDLMSPGIVGKIHEVVQA